MNFSLSWQDHSVIVAYLAAMLSLGVYLARRQKSDDEYFLAGRRMPWFAVGVSVIASLLSSLTYLSEPGEVWNSGATHLLGKMLAIPFEMIIVWIFCVPFMMRFRYTSAYEYLGDRFDGRVRLLGAVLFFCMVVLWMGFVVLVSARTLAEVSGVPLFLVILSIGAVATVYTMLGGLRAVIWTDVVQVVLLMGGGLFGIVWVAVQTGTGPPTWINAVHERLTAAGQSDAMPWFSWDPRVRATVITVAINMCVWHVCTHTANQMTVQRYFSTSDVRAARRSFVTGSLLGVAINLMLVTVGMAMLYYYSQPGVALDGQLDPSVKSDRYLIFPTFAVHRLPAGCGGAILAALLAAAMSSIDSGINSIATVATVELRRGEPRQGGAKQHVTLAMTITLMAGIFITAAAYGLTYLPKDWSIIDAMPRTFNAITAGLGGLFLIGMFIRRAGPIAAATGACCGLVTSFVIGYSAQIGDRLVSFGLLKESWPTLSFTWVMPLSLLATCTVAFLLSRFGKPHPRKSADLTW